MKRQEVVDGLARSSSRLGGRKVMYLTGSDGYEGLHAVLLEPADGEIEGVIVPDPWPEPPEWVNPFVE